MANVVNGNDIDLYVGGTRIGCLTGGEWSGSRAEIDVTCKDNDGDRAILLGGKTVNITFNGLFKPDSSYGLEDLFDIWDNGSEVSLAFGDFSNLTLYQQAYLKDLTWTAPLNAGSTFSGSFSATGTPVKTET